MATGTLTRTLFTPAGLSASVGAQAGALIAGRGVGLVRGVALAWLLSQHEFGILQLSVAVVNLLVPLTSLGLSHGILRYVPAHEAGGTLAAFTRRAAALLLTVAAAAAVLLLLAPQSAARFVFAAGGGPGAGGPAFQPVTTNLVRVAVACTFSLVIFHLVVDMMKGLRLFRAASVMETVGVVAFSVLAVTAPAVGFDSANAVLLAYGLGNLATVILFLPGLVIYIRSQPVRPEAVSALSAVDGTLIRFSVWMAASQVAWHGLQQYLLWHLAWIGGYRLAGTYFVVRLFAQLILLGAQTLARALSANVTRVWETAGPELALMRLEAGTKLGCIFILAGGAIVASVRPWILQVFPGAYAAGEQCLNPLVLAYALFGALEFLLIRFHLEEKSLLTFWTSVCGAVANVLLAFALIGVPGAPGADHPAAMLTRAGWVCAAGAACAVLTAWLLMAVIGKPPQPGTMLVVASIAVVGVGPGWGLALAAILAVATVTKLGVFSAVERTVIREWSRGR